MTRAQLADVEWEFIEPYLPIGEYGPYPVRLRQQFEGCCGGFGRAGSGGRCPPGSMPQVRAATSRAKAAMMTATRT
jgi:hypothetical protein